MIGRALYNYLKGVAAINAIISGRMYAQRLPQDPTLPAITYAQIGADDVPTMEGKSASNSFFNVTCWAESPFAAAQLADAVEVALHLYQGNMNSEESVSVAIKENRIDGFEEDVEDYRVILEFSIWHKPV